ncbi:hypothetical protein [Haliscomenobacter sp.]|uniref:hypothetical protein n=1 Tax=Haliscomenobacter sp. TaxID=2717303 RepID=UPI0035949213
MMIRFVPIFLLLFLVPTIRTNGCGTYFHHEQYRIAWFNPLLINDAALRAFHYNTYFEFQYPADPEQLDYRRNCQEWVSYLGPEVKEADVLQILYKIGPERFLNSLDDNQLAVRFKNNTFIQQLLQPDHAEALAYLTLAMRAEFAHFSSTDPWGLEEEDFDFFEQITPIIQEAKQKVKSINDPFLQRRYAYQLVVQYRYAENADECSGYCDEYFAWDSSPSILVPWAQYHKAECLTTQSNIAEANYLLSKVFDQCESKKLRVFQLFDLEKLDETWRYAKTAQEKAMLHTLVALMTSGRALDQIQQVIQLDPGSRYLPQLITREINKLEDWMLTPQLTFFEGGDHTFSFEQDEDPDNFMPGESVALLEKDIPYLRKNLAKDRVYLKELIQVLDDWSKNPAAKKPDFAHLAQAQLYYLDQLPVQVEAQLNQIQSRGDGRIQLQKQLIQLLIMPQQMNILSTEAKDEIARGLNRVKDLLPQSDESIRLYPKLMLYFSRMYQQKNDGLFAGLFYNRSVTIPKNNYESWDKYYQRISYFERFATLADLDALIALHQKKEQSALEKMLLAPLDPWEKLPYYYDEDNEEYKPKVVESAPSLDQAYELKGTVAFRQNRLEEALAAFEQLPDDYWEKNYAFSGYLKQDPFASPKTYPWEGESLEPYNKKVILRRMLELQKQAELPGPQQAEACYLLGNAYYNFTYWGKNWMMFAYGQSVGELYNSPYSSWENYSFQPNSKTYFKEYFQLSRATAYYHKAFKAKPTEDLAARIIFMLGTCDKYAHHNFDRPYWEEDETKPYISPIFNTFRDQFGHTEVFQECLNTCPELADFFKK